MDLRDAHRESSRLLKTVCVFRSLLELGLVLVEWPVLGVGWLIGGRLGQLVTRDGKALGLLLGRYVNLGLEIVIVFIHG